MTYQEIKAFINTYIVQNGVNAITGSQLNTALNALADYYGFDSVTVTTLPAGSDATVNVQGRTLELGIPKGADGEDGRDGRDGLDAVNPFKGWFNSLDDLKASYTASIGDSAYVKDASPATTWSIYIYDSTASSDNYWGDSGIDADTSNVQTFASGEEVNETYIDDTHLVNPVEGALPKAEDVKDLKDELYGYFDDTLESDPLTLPTYKQGTYQNATDSDTTTTYGAWYGAGNARSSGFIDLMPYKEQGYKKIKVTMYAFESNVHSAGRVTFVKKADKPTSGATGMSFDSLVENGYLSSVHDSYNKMVITCSSGATTILDIPEDAIGMYLQYRSATEGPSPSDTYRKPQSIVAFCKYVNGDIQDIQRSIQDIQRRVEELEQQYIDIPDGAITTSKIADGAVTEAKIADGAVNNSLTGSVEEYFSFNLINFNALTNGAYINSNDEIVSGSNKITDYIKLDGKKIYWGNGFLSSYGGINNIGAAIYDANKTLIRIFGAGGASSYDPILEEEGAEYIRLTYVDGYTLRYVVYAKSDGSNPISDQTGLTTGMIDDYYRDQVIKHSNLSSKLTKESVPELIPSYSSVGQNGFSKEYAVIGPEQTDVYAIISNSEYPSFLKCCHTISFNGYIAETLSGSDYIRLGLNRNNTAGKVLEITPTQAIIKRYDTNYGYVSNVAFTHNLTIKDFIMCEITFTWYGGKFRIISSGGSFVQEWQNSQYSYTGSAQINYGRAFVEPSITLTNAKLTQSSDRFMKPVWVIGDSYTSMNSMRWTYQLVNNFGIDGFLLDGYAGAPSENMVPELQRLLKFGTPKYLMWCMGMNDGPVIWKYCFTEVEMICRERGITLICQTLPYRTDSLVGKQAIINEYVKESGYRYVDSFHAVCKDDGTWYTGMKYDGAHPTELGAKALAGQVLVDFPEIANYK